MAHLIKVGGSDSRSVNKEFDPPIAMDVMRRIAHAKREGPDGKFTEPLRPEDLSVVPRNLRVSQPLRGRIPHILGWFGGPWIVSQHVRDLIDRLEPNVHEFLPIHMKGLARDVSHGTYHLIVLRQAVDAIAVDETDFIGGRGRLSSSIASAGACVLKAEMIVGRHLWRGFPPLHLTYFCSDQLGKQLKDKGLDGWDLRQRCTGRKTR